MSSIHYKFRALKDYDTYTFEGAGVPVWELKQEIIAAKKLNRANDFDLIISNAQTNQEYADDSFIIPKNTSVIVRRVPAAPGRRFFQPRTLTARPVNSFRPPPMVGAGIPVTSAPPGEEDNKIAAMMNESSSHWSQNQDMPSQTQFSSIRKNFRPKFPTAPPPPSYICFRCGQKGHYIANCPTNADPNYNRPKIRKTTGIPKTFLKPVETKPDGEFAAHPPSNVLISAEGNLVMLETNDELWTKVSGIHRVHTLDSDSAPDHFKCSLCARILTDPVYSSCCPNINYCDECIRNAILRNDNSNKITACRSCRQPITMDSLISNSGLTHEIVQFFGNEDHKRQRIV